MKKIYFLLLVSTIFACKKDNKPIVTTTDPSVPEFKDLNPTAENIAVVIYNKIKPKLDNVLKLEITLYETPRNFVTYSGS